MSPEDFDLLSGILRERSGLSLTKEKMYLLESRLGPVARKNGHGGLDDLVKALRQKQEEPLLRDITEAMTTNESFFFRDVTPFELLTKDVLPRLMEARAASKSLRIWCAAASTGQEPYTIAMVLKEMAAKLQGWRIEILATDISPSVLEKAKVGLYSQFEVQRGLPIQMLVKYFGQHGEMWQIDAALRGMIEYRELNLLKNLSSLGAFDIIFCRNVLIYFDRDIKTQVLESIWRLMPRDGALFLGGAETVLGISERFKPSPGKRGVYDPVPETEQ